ncbi:MAG TPA: gluconate 2-dehydrogenase subunit 3 family protein [Xanthobacteraceae bacterium]|nr:gluconate 2-dehydrogenase subunit 3 family protein [Xanthobacteraceae bacterium]
MPQREFQTLYPDYDVLAKARTPSWNPQTREVVRKRLAEVPPRRFFTELQWKTVQAVCDRVIPQPDRVMPVPIVPWLDAKLWQRQGDGTRYASLPPQAECWQRGSDNIEAEAQHRYARSFHTLDPVEQDLLLRAMDNEEMEAPAWKSLPSRSFFRHVLLRQIVEIYYAHPAAWSEIGFGGPASPRGYVRLGANRRDPWEGDEVPAEPLRAARAK